MKILLDPIYTTVPSRCASTIKMVRVYEHLSQKYDDMYFYWIIPNDLTEEERLWLPQDDRILYIPITMDKELDRYKQYSRLTFELENIIAFDGDYWDWDILVTNKTAMVPLYRMICYKPSGQRAKWSRKIVVLEDMPMMTFKGFVQLPPGHYADYCTLMGYLASDRVAICAYWEKARILELGKQILSSASVRALRGVLLEATPTLFDKVRFKSKDTITKVVKREKPFTISFSGRLIKGHRLEEIFEVMEKQWIIRSNDNHKIRCVLTTASKGLGARLKPPKFIEITPAPREEFWRIVKEESDVGVFLSVEEDYSMSVMEPLALGLPIAVYKCEWSIASLGPDYPFFIKSPAEAYGVIKAFYDNYPLQYKKFVDWSRNHLWPLLEERNKIYTPEVVDGEVETWRRELMEWGEGTKGSEIVNRMPPYIGKEPTRLYDAVHKMAKDYGDVDSFKEQTTTGRRTRTRLAYSLDWNNVRLTLMSKSGVRDAGVNVGVFRK